MSECPKRFCTMAGLEMCEARIVACVCPYSIIKTNRRNPVESRVVAICLYSFSTIFTQIQGPKRRGQKGDVMLATKSLSVEEGRNLYGRFKYGTIESNGIELEH